MLRFTALAATGLALLGLLLARPDAQLVRSAEPSTAAQSENAWTREVRELHERIAALELRIEALAVARHSEFPVADVAPRLRDVGRQEAAEAPLQGVAALSEALELEDRDDTWEDRIASYVFARLDDPRWSRSALLEIDCRATLCRLELEHASDAEARGLLASLSWVELEVGSSTSSFESAGNRTRSTLVLVRRV